MSGCITRRRFINRVAGQTAACALGIPLFSRSALGRSVSPNDKISLGFIGVGGMGSQHLRVLLRNPEVHVRAVCDVFESHRLKAKDRVDVTYNNQDCEAYNDFRALLDRDDVDAIVIATPDHWHVSVSIMACKAGKDVYSEKPLTHTINEGKALVRAVRRYGRVFQTGTQQRSSREFRFACELARRGKLGKIHTAELHLPPGGSRDWTPDLAPPPELDWDMWLGPAPRSPFNPAKHPGGFRFFWDYSGGALTDWGAHHSDIAQWGL
ncbi:MAG: Gfo/Idh/MocA family oxidoreductase, partial [bacterium]